jgi:signal transduction histidine kinase/DNA-binding NarL/FixJ family response regulator
LKEKLTKKLSDLENSSTSEYSVLVNTFNSLANEKLEIWEEVMNLHRSSQNMERSFTEIYSKLENKKPDTIVTETREKGFIGGIFGKNKIEVDTIRNYVPADTTKNKSTEQGFLNRLFKRKKIRYDTLIIEKNVEREALRNELHALESNIKQKDAQINILESKLIERNEEIGKKLNQLIQRRENYEAKNRLTKTKEADLLAQMTYKWLAVISAAAVLLLLVVIFLLFTYQKKSRAYQQALKNAKQEAENLARAKEQFAANVSHEIRTPVNAVYNLSEQLLQEADGDQMKKLSIINNSANHLKSIVNDTLDFSKIKAKKLKFNSINFSPSAVFEEVTGEQKIEAKRKDISLRYIREESVPAALMGDPLRLKQILINLVGNAIKFTEKGEVLLKVRAEPGTEGRINLYIEVKDTGIGISKENLELIFDEFVQLENKGGKKYSGTGLGLSIVKSLVELQDGSISVNSEPGKGTSISIMIPYSLGDKEKITETFIKTPVIPDHFRECSVLIADDEEFNRYVLKNIFNKWGVKYQEAVNGEEAIAKSLAINFDVILMDMRMPKKNGIEAAETILNVKPNSKIIAVTAADSNVERKYAMKAGMSGFLTKPFSENDLFNIVSPFMIANREEIHNRTSSELDTAELERLANGDINFLREMIRLYIKTSENGIIKIKEASSAEDWETVTETAHKLAAPSKHINAHSLYNKLKELELISQNGSDPSVINELCKLVEKKIKEVNYSLRDYLNSQGNE